MTHKITRARPRFLAVIQGRPSDNPTNLGRARIKPLKTTRPWRLAILQSARPMPWLVVLITNSTNNNSSIRCYLWSPPRHTRMPSAAPTSSSSLCQALQTTWAVVTPRRLDRMRRFSIKMRSIRNKSPPVCRLKNMPLLEQPMDLFRRCLWIWGSARTAMIRLASVLSRSKAGSTWPSSLAKIRRTNTRKDRTIQKQIFSRSSWPTSLTKCESLSDCGN